jgi:hypothetical protein
MSLQSLTDNPMIKNLFLKQLKKVVKEEGITLITISASETEPDELNFEVYKDEMKILTVKDFEQILENL